MKKIKLWQFNAFFAFTGITVVSPILVGTSCNGQSQVFIKQSSLNIVDGTLVSLNIADAVPSTLNIPNTVTKIGARALKDCSFLQLVNIPSSVTMIDELAFYACSKLETITFAENSQLKTIGRSAFAFCESLTSITIPESVTSISDNILNNCPKKVKVTNNSPVLFDWWVQNHQYGNETLSQMKTINLTQYRNSGQKPFTILGNGAFQYVNLLTDIDVANITVIGDEAFGNCFALTNITNSNNLTSIGTNAFRGCAELTSITIPDGVTFIGVNAFSGCTKAKYHVTKEEVKTLLIKANPQITPDQIIVV